MMTGDKPRPIDKLFSGGHGHGDDPPYWDPGEDPDKFGELPADIKAQK